MLAVNKPLVYLLIITIIGSFFAFRIITKAYNVYDDNYYLETYGK
ncbi:MAG: hypothetical protein AAB636_01600 [Patescibacteria group bacterium]